MLNFERYKTNIADICDTGDDIAVVNGVPVGCNTLCDCTECDFDGINETCNYQLLKWATSEYQEPEPKLTKREREFLESFEFRNNKIFRTETVGILKIKFECAYVTRLTNDMFPFIKQGETWTFENLLKLEVEE